MSDENEEIVVKIDDGTNVGDGGGDPVADLKAQYEELVAKDAVREAEMAAERRRADDATRRAEQSAREVTEAKTEAVDSQADAIATGLQSAQTEADSAEAEYVTAMEKGDIAAAGKAQRKMAKAEARIQRLDEAKSDVEARKATPAKPEEPAREVVSDPIDKFIASKTEPTARWLREHRDWVTDPKKNADLTRAHHHAVGEGLTPDTAEYFAHVEQRIGLRQDTNGKAHNGAGNGNGGAKPVRRPASPPVAPVNGGGGSGSSGNGRSSNEVTLRAFEAKAAQDGTHVWGAHDLAAGRIKDKSQIGKPIGIQEFARRVQKMKADGLYDKTLTE